MNYKFSLGNIRVDIKDEAKIELENINVEVEDLKLSDIPEIIRETAKIAKELNAMDSAGVSFQHNPTPAYQEASATTEEPGFPYTDGKAQQAMSPQEETSFFPPNHDELDNVFIGGGEDEEEEIEHPFTNQPFFVETPFGIGLAIPMNQKYPSAKVEIKLTDMSDTKISE